MTYTFQLMSLYKNLLQSPKCMQPGWFEIHNAYFTSDTKYNKNPTILREIRNKKKNTGLFSQSCLIQE